MRLRSQDDFLKELLEKQIINEKNFQDVNAAKASSNNSVVEALISLSIVPLNQLYSFLGDFVQVEVCSDLKNILIPSVLTEKVTAKIANHYSIIPLSFDNNVLKVCIFDPFKNEVLDDIRATIPVTVSFVLTPLSEIKIAFDKLYGVGAAQLDSMRGQSVEIDLRTAAVDVAGDESSIVGFVNQILRGAYNAKATDIHIEPFEDEVSVRYRVDGLLREVPVPSYIKNHQSNLTTRLKIISGLDISEHRLPQDGRIKVSAGDGVCLDLRVSTLPTPYGETINIRLLGGTSRIDLPELGFRENDIKVINDVIRRSHGMIFLTGPTGSGKTTTLYACLQRLNSKEKKIITLEDPIEYQIKGITQIQVQPKVGLTFGKGLRSVLRHDPDIIMVGEVRDSETAEISVRSSLTGHLVLSTLHTNDAVSAIARLTDMGIEPYLIASSLNCIIAQRLMRTLCASCKKETSLSADSAKILGLEAGSAVYEASGCDVCGNSGYSGRTVIAEVLNVSDKMRALIHERASFSRLTECAFASGMRLLRDEAIAKVLEGVTTVEELLRVTQG